MLKVVNVRWSNGQGQRLKLVKWSRWSRSDGQSQGQTVKVKL